jgi:hypothetical protein
MNVYIYIYIGTLACNVYNYNGSIHDERTHIRGVCGIIIIYDYDNIYYANTIFLLFSGVANSF